MPSISPCLMCLTFEIQSRPFVYILSRTYIYFIFYAHKFLLCITRITDFNRGIMVQQDIGTSLSIEKKHNGFLQW